MSLQAQLSALTVPSGTEFPGTVQALLDLIAAYEEIIGLEDFTGINFGATTPSADNRDRPWFQTTGSGDPIGWYAWTGSAWVLIPQTLPVGTTAQRPNDPQNGQQYFDTDCGCAIIYLSGSWTTLSGSTGDVKYVKAATLVIALARNPGWIQDPDSIGRTIIGAGTPTDLPTPRTYGELVGEETTTLHPDNIATHQHETFVAENLRYSAATGNTQTADGALAGWIDWETGFTPPDDDDQQPIGTYQPSIAYWALQKS